MNVSLYQAAAAMNAQARWQELISNNLASSSVPGFRKSDISFSAVAAGMNAAGAGAPGSSIMMPSSSISTNFTAGPLKPTGSQKDFAVDGPGFFEVQLPDGSRGYTRDGEFQLNAQGQLVTKKGYLVLSDAGPVQSDPSNPNPISVAPTGEISQGSDTKGRLRVVEFANPKQLTAIGEGCFIPEKGVTPTLAVASSVRQGFLESANTTPTVEMAHLITAMRMFEANQRVISSQDDRLGKVISEIGSPS